MSEPIDHEARRRRQSKRRDERAKLLANFLNGAGIATLVVSLISPIMQGADLLNEGHALAGFLIAIMFHCMGQVVLTVLRGE